eukprot:scaffold20334_cov71-Cyclotella_meneghiniana.AAC.1
MYRTLQNTTAGGRCVKDVKHKDTPESIFFLSFLCMLMLLLWDPEGLAGAQRRLVILKEMDYMPGAVKFTGQRAIRGDLKHPTLGDPGLLPLASWI